MNQLLSLKGMHSIRRLHLSDDASPSTLSLFQPTVLSKRADIPKANRPLLPGVPRFLPCGHRVRSGNICVSSDTSRPVIWPRSLWRNVSHLVPVLEGCFSDVCSRLVPRGSSDCRGIRRSRGPALLVSAAPDGAGHTPSIQVLEEWSSMYKARFYSF